MDTQEYRKFAHESDQRKARINHDRLVRKESLRNKHVFDSITGPSLKKMPSDIPEPDFKFPLVNSRYQEMIALFGRPTGGGEDFVMWDEPSFRNGRVSAFIFGSGVPPVEGIIYKLYITGEMTAHNNHVDFLYTKSRLQVLYNKEKAEQIDHISSSIHASTRDNYVKAGCHFFGANLASIYIASKVGMGMYDDMYFARCEYKALTSALREENMAATTMGEEYTMENHLWLLHALNSIYLEVNKKPIYEQKEELPYEYQVELQDRNRKYRLDQKDKATGRERDLGDLLEAL